uniref:Uncharacterized protein n=1 Tax=Arundo donax TaxID=35708 RepID=A0A0A8YRY7_ARUDO
MAGGAGGVGGGRTRGEASRVRSAAAPPSRAR